MKKEDFNLLLTDLYTAYNPDYVEHVPKLVEKYSGMEYAAIDMVLLKYNRKSASFYDPKKDTDDFKLGLIKDYSQGNRTLKDFKLVNEANKIKEQEAQKLAEEGKKIEENVNRKLEELHNSFSGKEKELMEAYEKQIHELNDKLSKIQPVKTSPYDGVEIRIICNYTENPVKFPNKESILGMGVGARIVTTTTDGKKVVGLKVSDIIYDLISDLDGKPMIEIMIDKE